MTVPTLSGPKPMASAVGGQWHDHRVGTRKPLSSTRLVELSTELPGVLLKESDSWTNVTFRGKGFAWVNHPAETAMIKAHLDERDALVGSAPEIFEAGWTTRSTAWVRVRLPLADPEEVVELLEEGWRMTATKRAAAELDAARAQGRR